MAKALQGARPVVGATTCLHADEARRKVHEERGHLVAPQLLAPRDLAMLIHCVNLEHVLCQINANSRNLHGGRPFQFKCLLTLPLWHIDAGTGGGVHPIGYGWR
ncbi:hypothetical protein FQZ97_990400 [compost metagenome]